MEYRSGTDMLLDEKDDRIKELREENQRLAMKLCAVIRIQEHSEKCVSLTRSELHDFAMKIVARAQGGGWINSADLARELKVFFPK